MTINTNDLLDWKDESDIFFIVCEVRSKSSTRRVDLPVVKSVLL